MSARFWIICACALSANTGLAETPRAQLFLGDAASEDRLIWQPAHNGLTRYQLQLPQSGVEDAQKYQDTAALFYLSQKSDLGLQLTEEQQGHFKFILTPEETKAIYTQSLTPALSYHLGLQVEGIGNGAHLGASWRTVTGHTQIDEITAAFESSDATLTWTRCNLIGNERSERLYSISSNLSDLQASFGTRWFDLLHSNDFLFEVGIDNEALVIGAQLERNVGSANGFFGATGNLSTGNVNLTLGLQYALGHTTGLNMKTNAGLASHNIKSLKYFRRAALPSHWRRSIHLE